MKVKSDTRKRESKSIVAEGQEDIFFGYGCCNLDNISDFRYRLIV